MITPDELLKLYNTSNTQMFSTIDLHMDGSTQKSFHNKYDVVLYHIIVYLMTTQFISKPVFITLRKYEGHPFYYSSRGIHINDIVIHLQPLLHNSIKKMIEDQPNRVYLFYPSQMLPSELTPKEKKLMNTYFCHLMKRYNKTLSMSMFKNEKYKNILLSNLLFLYSNQLEEISELKEKLREANRLNSAQQCSTS